MFSPFLSIFVQLIYSSQPNSHILENDIFQVCFYFKDKNKCPPNIKNYICPNDYGSNALKKSNKSFEIFIAEPIKLNQPLLFSSPTSYFLKGQQIIGDIELGCQTRLYIQDATLTNIKINWSIKSKQISKIYTESKAKSILIKAVDKVNVTSSYNLFFYSGNETKILFSKNQLSNDKTFNISLFNRNLKNYVNVTLYSDPSYIFDSGKLGDNVYYELIESEYLYVKTYHINIKGKGDMYNFENSPFSKYEIPYEFPVYIEEGVTSIGSFTFSYQLISEIKIPNTVRYIGSNAFTYSHLYSVYIPDSVTYFDDSAFENSTRLEYINTPTFLTYIGNLCFSGCESLKSITFYEELTTIGELAFYGCYSLTSINFVNCNKLSTIKLGAFYLCISLTSIKIPDKVDSIQASAFRKCSSLKEVVLPNQLTIIDKSIFYYCHKLESIKLPEKVTKICAYSFMHCSSIETIHIPKNVEIIEDCAFLNCYRIKSFSVDEKNLYFSTIDGMLTSIEKNVIYYYPPNKNVDSYEIPNNIVNLSIYSFCYCLNLKHITIPSSIEIIPSGTFQLCKKLESVTILGNCKIGHQCFNYCYDLVSIVYLGENDAYLFDIMVADYNNISVYVPNNYISDSFCGYSVIKTNDISCRAIHHKCIECNDNICTKCEKGWIIENSKCIPDCKSISLYCTECTTTGICLSCEKGYILENGQCIETNICDDIISNCGVCHKSSDNFYCDHCFDGYKLSLDGLQCIQNTNISFQKYTYIVDPNIYVNALNIYNVIYNFSSYYALVHLTNFSTQDSVALSLETRRNFYSVYIMTTIKNIELNVVLPPIKNKPIIINKIISFWITLRISCPRGSVFSFSGYTIPNLRGSRTIEIISPFSIDNVILDEESSEPLTLKTINNYPLSITEIQIKNKQKLISEVSYCKTIIINPYSELTLEKAKVNTVKIGFSASINIRNEETIVYHFYILPTFSDFNQVPVKFYQPFPRLNESDIYFDDTQTIMLNQISNEYIAAKFIGENENINRDACSSLKISEKNSMYHSKCIKDEFGPNYNFVVTISFDIKIKKKIISGEIASYVICGAVCLTILILFIYYVVLNIKYKCTKIDENSIDENQLDY